MRIKKTSQYMAGGATLSNEYGTSQVNGYTQDFINGTVLYNNDSGTQNTITLSDSLANYGYIEICYGYKATNTIIKGSIKIISPDENDAALDVKLLTSSALNFIVARIAMSDTNISFTYNRECVINNNGTISFDTTRLVSIFRVVGYNKTTD